MLPSHLVLESLMLLLEAGKGANILGSDAGRADGKLLVSLCMPRRLIPLSVRRTLCADGRIQPHLSKLMKMGICPSIIGNMNQKMGHFKILS